MSEICRYLNLNPGSATCRRKIQTSGAINKSGIRECHAARLAELRSNLQALDPLNPKRQEAIAEAQEKVPCNGYKPPLRCAFDRFIALR